MKRISLDEQVVNKLNKKALDSVDPYTDADFPEEEEIIPVGANFRALDEVNDKKEMYFEYLDELRESGVTNMFGARPYLMEEFGLEKHEAGKILSEWMETFGKRHPKAIKERLKNGASSTRC